jgi:protein gp37
VVTPEEAARDIPKLLRTPAAIHFLSIEPMLAAMNIDRWLWDDDQREGHVTGLDWVIAGGESGGHARPLNPDWIRGLRDQCSEAGVDFFFKQWGEWAPPDAVPPEKWHDRHTYDSGAYMMRVGKDVAGAKLDGCLLRARPPHQTPSIRLAH